MLFIQSINHITKILHTNRNVSLLYLILNIKHAYTNLKYKYNIVQILDTIIYKVLI